MNNLNKTNLNNYSSDLDYHFNEIEKDINRAKLDNNKNFVLFKLFETILSRINLIKGLIISNPKAYFNTIYLEMKILYKKASRELDGFHITILLKKDAKPERMGFIKLSVNKKILKDEG